MHRLVQLLIGLVALIHGYILWLEMLAGTTRGPKTFRLLRPELLAPTKVLAANQGLYNGFLATGLIWALLIADPTWHSNVTSFFPGGGAVASIYGALTAGGRILLVQTLPTLLALAAVWLA